MNKKLITISAAAILIGTALLLPAGAEAFWPFDGIGQVLGAETQPTGGGFMGLIGRFFGHGTTVPSAAILNQGTPSGTMGSRFSDDFGPRGASGTVGMGTGDQGLCNIKPRLDAAVTAGKLTSVQETAILTQTNAICAEQQKLMQLQSAFRSWLQSNNLSTAIFSGEPPHTLPFVGSPSGATGVTTHPNFRVPSQGNGGGGHPPTTNVGTNTEGGEH